MKPTTKWTGGVGCIPTALHGRGFSRCHGCQSDNFTATYQSMDYSERINIFTVDCHACGRVEQWKIEEAWETDQKFNATKIGVHLPKVKPEKKYSDYEMAKATLKALGPKDAEWTDEEIKAATRKIAQDVATRVISSAPTQGINSTATITGTYQQPIFKKQTTMRDGLALKMKDPNNYAEHLERAVTYASLADAALIKIATFDDVNEISELERFLLELKAEKAKGYIALAQLHAQIAGVLS